LKRPASFFLPNYASLPFTVQPFENYDGHTAVCEVCGYLAMRATLKDGWTVETCSAMPALPALQSREFNEWLSSLPKTKLPTTCV
jgi:hypothetical protein